MEWLTSTYPHISSLCLQSVPEYWPALTEIIRSVIEPDLPVEAALPIASCKAVGGNPMDAVPAAAALIAAEIGVRILDDLADQDKDGIWEEIGMGRTYNYGAALNTLSLEILHNAHWSKEVIDGVSCTFRDAFLMVAAGQDRDLGHIPQDIEDYWMTIEMKTSVAYSTACACGAMTGTSDSEQITALANFGTHLGLAIQVINDLKSIWGEEGVSDIMQNKVTLPVIYGLSTKHEGREELQKIVSEGRLAETAETVKKLLDAIDTRKFLVWTALKERERALEVLEICPDEEGKEQLKTYLSELFTNIDSWLETPLEN